MTRAVRRGLGRALARTALLGVVVLTGLLGPLAQAGIGAVHAAPFGVAAGLGGGPGASYAANTLARFHASGNAWGQTPPPHTPAYNPPLPAPAHATGKSAAQMGASAASTALAQPVSIALDPILLSDGQSPAGPALSYTSSDGLLGLQVSEHSLDVSQAVVAPTPGPSPVRGRGGTASSTAPVGPYTLALTQTQGGLRGQEQQIGQFALSVRDSQGRPLAGVQLVVPITLEFHVLPSEMAGVNPNGLELAWVGTGSAATSTRAAAAHVGYDAATGWLTANSPVAVTTPTPSPSPASGRGEPLPFSRRGRALAPDVAAPASGSPLDPGAGPLALDGTLSDANAASSEHLSMDGNQGDLGFGVPLDLPPAAGGLVPPLQLSYSSAGPNGRHERQAPAGAVGDGWDLTLGSISYDSTTNLFYLNGVAGDSEPLLCCMVDGNGYHWYAAHHHPELQIITADNDTNPQTSGMWFKVRTPDGLEYDLGRSGGSLRATVDSSGHLLYYEWDVSEVLRNVPNTPTGYLQSYTAQYWQDTATSQGVTYTRDAALKEIDYNYGPQSGGSGNPSPMVRLLFNVHWPQATQSAYGGLLAATQYPTNYNCASTPPVQTTLRCDDPVAQSGWDPAPLTMSTFTLDSLTEQVATSYSPQVWQRVRQYQFSYAPDSPFYTCWDGQGLNYACSGEHLLSSVQEVPYQNGTAEPSIQPITFGYTGTRKNEYHDATEYVGGNPEDAQTWWQYLNAVNDEQTGRHFSATYETGWGNTHAVPSGSQTDPTTCNFVSNCFPTGQPNQWPDDRQWPHQLVTSTTDVGTGLVTNYAYQLAQPCGSNCTQDSWIAPNGWNACNGQPQSPGNPNPPCLEGSWQTFYNEDFMGFAQVTVTHPDGSSSVTQYEAGAGWGSNDWAQADVYDGMPVVADEYQGAPGGTPLEEARSSYLVDGNGNAICPVTSGTSQLYKQPYELCFQEPTSQTTYVGGGQGTSPAVPSTTQTWTYNTNSQTSANHYYLSLTSATVTGNDLLADSFTNYGTTQPTFTTSYSYTFYDGGSRPYYLVNRPVQVTLSDQQSTQWACSRANYDSQGYTTGLNSNLQDGLLTERDTYSDAVCGNASSQIATGIGYDAYGQPLVSTDADGMAGVSGHTGCTVPAGTLLQGAPVGAAAFTSCAALDATAQAYPASQANALSQTASTAWDAVQGVPTGSTDANHVTTTYGGPVYEYSGAPSLATFEDVYAQVAEPQAQYGWNTREYSYSFCAIATTSTAPCVEQDTVTNLDGTDMAVSRSFYDRDGRWVETRTEGPAAGTDTVTFATYDDLHDKAFASQPCQVSAFVGSRVVVGSYTAPGGVSSGPEQGSSTAYVDPATSGGSCGTGTALASTTYSDALGRTIAADDPIGTGVGTSGTGCLLAGGTYHHTSCAQYTVVDASGVSGLPSTDSEPYLQTISVDANGHQSASYTDALGQTAYTQRDQGTSQSPGGSGISSYAVSSFFFDALGRLRRVVDPDGNVTSYTLDAAGRLTAASDPDLGAWSYTLDPNGNVTQQVDARGASGTTYAFYDGLDRLSKVSTDAQGNAPLVTYLYDQQGTTCPSSNVSYPVGRLCQEQFSSNGVTGSYTYTYDLRGRTYDTVLSLSGPSTPQASYSLSAAYDDADRLIKMTIPKAGTFTASEFIYLNYDNTRGGGLDSITSAYSSPTTLLAHHLSYSVQGWLTGWQSGSDAPYQAGFIQSQDGDGRLVDRQLTLTPQGGQVAQVGQVQPTYDAAGNVASVTTSLGAIPGVAGTGGNETQAFCYDAQDRLTWASTQGTGACGTAGSEGISGAGYTATYSYDPIGRITSQAVTTSGGSGLAGAAQGSYSYGDPAHTHGVTGITSSGTPSYSAAYDAAGEMTCRVLASASCTNTPATGQTLTYDALRRLISWQGTTPGDSEQYAEDGEGNRVWRQTQSGGTTTTTVSILGVEDVTMVSGGATTTTRYYALPGGVTATRDASGLVYEATDQLGTPIASLNLSTGIVGEQLRAPYGQARYAANGTGSGGGMRTPFGFTGQREDTQPNGASGLDYFNARYYDAATGRFTSADDAQPGLGDPSEQDNYAYVGGMVESATDPSGHSECEEDVCLRGDAQDSKDSGSGGWAQGLAQAIEQFIERVQKALYAASDFLVTAMVGLATTISGLIGKLIPGSTTLVPDQSVPAYTGPVGDPGPTENQKTKIPPIPSGGGMGTDISPGTGTPTRLPLPGFQPSENEGDADVADCQDVAVQYMVGDKCAIELVDKYIRAQYKRFTGKQARAAKSRVLVCPYCGIGMPNTVDHIRSQHQDWDEGGYNDDRDTRSARVNTPGNLIGACGSCNSSKGDTPLGPGADEWWPPAWPAGVWWPFGGP